MSGFTKGPWTVEDRGYHGFDVLAAVDGWSSKSVRIANAVPFKNSSANAHLIAAAPEMYEALNAAHTILIECAFDTAGTPTHDFFKSEAGKLGAILAKAEGRSL